MSMPAGIIRTTSARRSSNRLCASCRVTISGRTAVEASNSLRICCDVEVFDSSTTNKSTRGSSSRLPPARRKVNTRGRMIKNSNSDGLENRIIASFQAMARIFFIGNSLLLHNPVPAEQNHCDHKQHRAHDEQGGNGFHEIGQ